MSLEIVRAVAREFPELRTENLGSTCWQHTVYVIDRLRKAGHDVAHIAKTAGEGQYTPPGFQPRVVAGLDGKPYTITGVSHDAIWCDGKQYDTLAKANDSQTPIFEPDGRPMIAIPVWNEIPREYWRPNNPPLPPIAAPTPTPQPEPSKVLPKALAYAELKALDAFYRAPEGLQRPEGLGDVEAIAQWFYQLVIEGISREQVFAQIRSSDEWRRKHP